MAYFQVTKQFQGTLIKLIREPKSQEQLNRVLKAGSNQVHRWETGKAEISWSTFCRLCEARKVPLRQALREVVRYHGSPSDSVALLEHLGTSFSTAEFCRKMNVSKSMASRWKSKRSAMTLRQVLRLIEISTISLEGFLAQLLGSEKAEFLLPVRAQVEKQNLHVDIPWISALLSYLDHPEYLKRAHPNGFFVEKLKISEQQEKQAIDLLVRSQIVLKDGAHIRNLPRLKNSSTSGRSQAYESIRSYWTKRLLSFLKIENSDQLAYWPLNLMSVDEKSYQKIQARLAACRQEVADIALKSQGEEMVLVMMTQLIDITKLPLVESPRDAGQVR